MIRLILKSNKTFDQFTEQEIEYLQSTFLHFNKIQNSIEFNTNFVFDALSSDSLVIDNLPVKVDTNPIRQYPTDFNPAVPFEFPIEPTPIIPAEPTPIIPPSVTINGLTFEVLGAWFGYGSKIEELVPVDSSFASYFLEGSVIPDIPNSQAGYGWPWI